MMHNVKEEVAGRTVVVVLLLLLLLLLLCVVDADVGRGRWTLDVDVVDVMDVHYWTHSISAVQCSAVH